jgi:ABC-type branched-subunit amino acid transport system ATPase component
MLMGVDAAQAAKVKVGFIAPFSGGFALWGKQFKDSVQAFQKLHGTSINGTEIEVIYRDVDGPDPAKAKQLAEELILRDRIKILTGLVFSNNTMALAPVIDEAKIPFVIMNAATSKITRMSDMFVRVSMTLPQQSRPVALWAAKNDIKTVYTIVSDYAPGHDAEKQFIKDFTSKGGKIVKSVRIPLRTTDYAPFLENVLQAKPDALYIFMPAGPPSIATVNAWAKRGLKKAGIQLLATGEMQQLYLPAVGDAAIQKLKPEERVKRGLVRTHQINTLLTETNVRENAAIAVAEREGYAWRSMRYKKQWRACLEEAQTALDDIGIGGVGDQLVSELPYGQQRLLEIVIALVLKPRVLLLDEPGAGAPSSEVHVIHDALDKLPADIAILIIEHDMDLVFRFAAEIIVLVQGAILTRDVPARIAANEEVRAVYLGRSME